MGKSSVDVILCDVVEMDVCHIILGRPWQYDVDATPTCKDNVYVFFKNGRKIDLGLSRRVVYLKLLKKWRGDCLFFWLIIRTNLTRKLRNQSRNLQLR